MDVISIVLVFCFVAFVIFPLNLTPFIGYFLNGWHQLESDIRGIRRPLREFKDFMFLFGIPGAILGFLAGALCFRWIIWAKRSYDYYKKYGTFFDGLSD